MLVAKLFSDTTSVHRFHQGVVLLWNRLSLSRVFGLVYIAVNYETGLPNETEIR